MLIYTYIACLLEIGHCVPLFQRKPPTQNFYPEDGGSAFFREPVTFTKLDGVTYHMTAAFAVNG